MLFDFKILKLEIVMLDLMRFKARKCSNKIPDVRNYLDELETIDRHNIQAIRSRRDAVNNKDISMSLLHSFTEKYDFLRLKVGTERMKYYNALELLYTKKKISTDLVTFFKKLDQITRLVRLNVGDVYIDQISSGKASVLIEIAEMKKELISLESKISSKKLLLDKYICKIEGSSFSDVRKISDVRTVTEKYNKYCEPMLTDICFLKTEIKNLQPNNGNVKWNKKKNWKKKY